MVLRLSDEERVVTWDKGTSHRHMGKAGGGASTGSVSSAPQITSLWVAKDTFNPRWLSEKGLLVLKLFGASINRA